MLPREPADLIVLAIRIVVAVLGAAELVTGAKHRYTLAQEERGEKVSPLAVSQCVNGLVRRRSLGTAVPGIVVVFTVAVPLAVRLIMFFIVADKVVESKPVMRSNEVNGGVRPLAGGLVKVRRRSSGKRSRRPGQGRPSRTDAPNRDSAHSTPPIAPESYRPGNRLRQGPTALR